MKKTIGLLCISVLLGMFSSCSKDDNSIPSPTDIKAEKEALGEKLFFDASLSEPVGQSCATCHAPDHGFADVANRMVSEGAYKGYYGNRNAPTAAYAMYIPPLTYSNQAKGYVGGVFWDGRAENLKEQAKGPFMNPLEMGNTSAEQLVNKLRASKYYNKFIQIYGNSNTPEQDFDDMAEAIAMYENTKAFCKFNSKYDDYQNGTALLSAEEQKGLELFSGKAKCAACHILTNDPIAHKPVFTNYTYDNLGIPKNPENPYYHDPTQYNPDGTNYLDPGLKGNVNVTENPEAQLGKFRVPTLRNIALTAPYGHNGYFKTLDAIVHFYNKRDVDPTIEKPEHSENMNKTLMGNLGLTPEEEKDIVAFLNTLSDK